jgi:hypothetical protein
MEIHDKNRQKESKFVPHFRPFLQKMLLKFVRSVLSVLFLAAHKFLPASIVLYSRIFGQLGTRAKGRERGEGGMIILYPVSSMSATQPWVI